MFIELYNPMIIKYDYLVDKLINNQSAKIQFVKFRNELKPITSFYTYT